MDHFVPDDDDDRRNVEPRAARQEPRDQKDRARRVARRDAKPDLKKFINRNDVVVVKGPDEKIRDDDPRDHRPDRHGQQRELNVLDQVGLDLAPLAGDVAPAEEWVGSEQQHQPKLTGRVRGLMFRPILPIW